MQIIKTHYFIEELADFLIIIFNALKTTYTFGKPLPDAVAIFLPDCILPLFLYDKQKYINKFCREKLAHDTYFNINFQQVSLEYSAMRIKLSVQHNILYEYQYNLMMKFLVTLITKEVSEKIKPSNHLDIEPLYLTCMDRFLSKFYS